MAIKYCPNCGYANDAERGACLMCHARLPAVAVEEGQQPVPVADAPPGPEAMAAVLIEAAEGSLGGMAGGAMGAEDDVEAPEEYEMAGLEEVSTAEPTPAPYAEPIEEVAAAEPAEEAAEEAEEEYIPPPPPPGAVELEEETAEAVAGAPEQYAAEQEFPEAPPAPPAPEEVFELDEPAAEEEAEESAGGEWTIGGD